MIAEEMKKMEKRRRRTKRREQRMEAKKKKKTRRRVGLSGQQSKLAQYSEQAGAADNSVRSPSRALYALRCLYCQRFRR